MRLFLALVLFLITFPAHAADLIVRRGATSVIAPLFVQHGTTEDGLTGLAYNTGSLTCYYKRNTAASPVQITLVTNTAGTYVSGGFVEVSSSNMPGAYELGIPNAALIAGADNVVVVCRGAANMRTNQLLVQLINYDLDTSTQTVTVGTNNDKTGYSLSPSQTFTTSGSVGAVSNPVTVGTNNDKTGYRISGTKQTLDSMNDPSPQAIWSLPLENFQAAGSAGQYLDRAYHYTSAPMIIDTKTKRYSLKKDDCVSDYESGTTTLTERTPDRTCQ